MRTVARCLALLPWLLLLSGGCGSDDFPRMTVPPFCGDGHLDPGEACDDGREGNGDDQPNRCRLDCTLPRCGDGQVDAGEECDGPLWWDADCGAHGFEGGALVRCRADCTLDLSACARCGDARAAGTEAGTTAYETCDGSDLRGLSCAALGRGEGTLACTDRCVLTVAACDDATPMCGNGIAEHPEGCDDGNHVDRDGCSARCQVELVTWSLIDPEEPSPTAWGRSAALAFDPPGGRLVLLRGPAYGEESGETWAFDGRAWAEVAGPQPPGRGGVARALCFDGRGLLLFGGEPFLPDDAGGPRAPRVVDDLWRLEGQTWQRLAPGAGPPPRREHAMAYDTVRDRVVLFGGVDGAAALADTWEWDGAAWRETTPEGSPPGGGGYSLVVDSRRQVAVLHGGVLGETWEYVDARWERAAVASPGNVWAAPLAGPVVFDPRRGRTLLFAEQSGLHPTWELTEGGWVPLPVAYAPEGRRETSLVWNPLGGYAMLHGGRDHFNSWLHDLHRVTWVEVW